MAHTVFARISFRPLSAQILVMHWISVKGEFWTYASLAFISTFASESWVLVHHGYCRLAKYRCRSAGREDEWTLYLHLLYRYSLIHEFSYIMQNSVLHSQWFKS